MAFSSKLKSSSTEPNASPIKLMLLQYNFANLSASFSMEFPQPTKAKDTLKDITNTMAILFIFINWFLVVLLCYGFSEIATSLNKIIWKSRRYKESINVSKILSYILTRFRQNN